MPVDTIAATYIYTLEYFEGKMYMATQKGLFSTIIQSGEQPENPDEHHILLYPNPATKHLTISTPGIQGAAFQLYRADGRLMLNEPIGKEPRRIDISTVPAGIYVYRLQMSNGRGDTGQVLIIK